MKWNLGWIKAEFLVRSGPNQTEDSSLNEYKVNFFKSNGNKPVREAYRRLEDVLERNRIEVAESTISGGIGQMFIRTKRSESWLRRLIAKQAFDAAIEVHLLRTAEKEVA